MVSPFCVLLYVILAHTKSAVNTYDNFAFRPKMRAINLPNAVSLGKIQSELLCPSPGLTFQLRRMLI